MADAGAATTAALTATTWLADMTAIAHLATSCVAIMVGLASLWWYIEKARKVRRERLNEDAKDVD